MKFLDNVRQKARFCREKIFVSPANLLEKVEKYITDTHGIELTACHKDFIDGGKAELRPLEGLIYYDEELNSNLAEKLWVILHELGHLEQHKARLTKLTCHPDPIYNEIYGLAGTDSLARYNPRSLEEVEANAFATEFLCPSDKAFQLWLSSPDITLNEIAEHFGSPAFIVRSQLAGALHELAFEDNKEAKETKILKLIDNPKQEEAARCIGSPVLVDAGPGTGKTATLIKRIEFLLAERKEDPSSILVLTFSNEACSELYERISSKFDEATASQIRIATFHGFGLSLIQLHGHHKDLDLNTCILDEAGQRELLNEVLGDLHNLKVLEVSKPDKTVKEAFRHISFLKERMISPKSFEGEINKMSSEEAVKKENAQDLLKIFEVYENLKDSRNKLDFADLIQKSVDIFDKNSDVVKINREKYKWVLVDEYQDVSRATAVLLQRLCGTRNPPWVVGDKRQSIFRFCGANPENIDKFNDDFPNAKKFTLDINFRSAEPLVKNKNKLANLMQNEVDKNKEIWTAAPDNPKPEISPAISLAVAESDQAERNGIVRQVQSWIEQKMEIKDIAVLARRNEDVRNIVIDLNKNSIPAVASGIVTAEGAAGDLVNVITFADNPIPSIPRLVYCLGKHNHKKEDLDKLIAFLIENFSERKEFSVSEDEATKELSQEIIKIYNYLSEEKFASDAFSTICELLFESSSYLRKLLDSPDKIKKSLAINEIATILMQSLSLNEIVTTLTQAATYRFSHQGDKPHISRKNFAKYFRESLSQSNTPTTAPPSQLNADAVKVMTCHASKGLEFPYVIVSGQTLSGMIGKRGEYKWLPATLAPRIDDDIDQADSTLFVGMSRAKQGLTVSYSKTSTGLPTAKQRKVVPLLQGWSNEDDISKDEWNSFEATEKEYFETNKIWGGNIKYPIASRKLDKGECSLATYLQDGLSLKFPLAEKSFYPSFYVAIRTVLRSIVIKTFEEKRMLTLQEAMSILQAFWDFEDFHIHKDHTHHNLYWNLAQKYVKGFIHSFAPEVGNAKFIDLIIDNNGWEIELDLVCAYILNDGSSKAIFFRSESLEENLSKKNGLLLWSGIKDSHRNAFILLQERFPNLQIKVYSGTDEELYDFQWGQERFIAGQKAKIKEKYETLTKEIFIGEIIENTCNYRCDNRINCPHWIGALN